MYRFKSQGRRRPDHDGPGRRPAAAHHRPRAGRARASSRWRRCRRRSPRSRRRSPPTRRRARSARARTSRRRSGAARDGDRPAPARLAAARDDAALHARSAPTSSGASDASSTSTRHMKLWSDSWGNGEPHPERYAAGQPDAPGGVDLLRQPQPAPGVERAARRHAVAGADLPRLRRAEPRRRRQPGRPRGAGRPAARRLLPLGAGRPAGGRDARSPKASSAAASRARGKPGPAVAVPGFEARARASTTTPAGSPATPRWPATTSATTARSRRSTTRWSTTTCSRSTRSTSRARRSRAASPAPQLRQAIYGHVLGRGHAFGHLHAEPAAARLTDAGGAVRTTRGRRASSRSATARRPGTPRCACRASSTSPLSDTRPLAGARASPRRSPARASRRSTRATWCAPSTPRRRSPRGVGLPIVDRHRPARAQLRRVPGLHLRRDRRALARADARAGGAATRTFAPEGGETLREFYARASPPRRAHRRARTRARRSRSSRTAACWTACTAPRRASTSARRARGSSATPAINRLLYTPQGFTLVGWSDTAHLDGDPLDDGSEGDRPMPVGPRRAIDALPMSAAAARRRSGRVRSTRRRWSIDLDAMERNLAAHGRRSRAAHGVRLRPHAKMHKCAAHRAAADRGRRGRRLRAEGERGRGARRRRRRRHLHQQRGDRRRPSWRASPRLAGAGPAGDRGRFGDRRRAARARRCARPARAIDVFVEVDVGHGRCGVAAGGGRRARAAGRLAAPPEGGLRFAGLQAYHGAAQHLRGADEREAAIAPCGGAGARRAGEHRRRRHRLPARHRRRHRHASRSTSASGVWGELQAGSYLFMDRDYADNAPAPDAPRFEHALFVKSQVMSRGAAHAVVDAGHKSHAIDSGPAARLAARARRSPTAATSTASCACAPARRAPSLPALGETVWLVPGHCDPTVNLHDRYVVVRGGLEPAWSRRSGRSRRAAASAERRSSAP